MSTLNSACQYGSNIFNLNPDMVSTTGSGGCSASATFLQSIFGQPINVLTGNATMTDPVNSLVTLFLGHFNTLGLALVMAIFSYVVFHGFISTVNEGKFGGRDMGHWSYSLRAILPGAMLVPVKGGFCAMQFVIMYFILVGVNLANVVWQKSVGDISFGYTPTTPSAIKSAIATAVAQDYVAGVVSNLAQQYKKPIAMGDISIWDSPYANAAMKQMTNVCNNLATGSDYTSICTDNLKQLQQYKEYSIVAPLGGSNLGSTSPYMAVKIHLANQGKVNLGGSYSINTNPTANESPILQTAMNGLSDQITASADKNTLLSCGGKDSVSCSFAGAIGKVQNSLIASEPKNDGNLSKVVTGTGETCQATCRVSGSQSPYAGSPIPGVTKASECTSANIPKDMEINSVEWTQQCYVKHTATTKSMTKYDEVPAQLIGNSWWYGSRVYLQLNRAMANNITRLAKAVESLQIPTTSLLNYTPPKSTVSVPYSVAAIQKTYELTSLDQTDGYNNQFATTGTGTNKKPIPQLNGEMKFTSNMADNSNNNDALNSIPWDKITSCYATYLPKGETPQSCLRKAMGVSQKPSEIVIGNTSSNAKGYTLEASPFPSWVKTALGNVPVQFQNPLKLLMIMNITNSKTISDDQFETILKNIIHVLQYNHVYPGTYTPGQTGISSAGETTPVNTWINKVFNHLMGQNLPGPAGGGQGIFSQIYSLGNTNISSLQNVMKHSFNTMANAQKIGLAMINVVTTSLQSTYSRLNHELNDDQRKDTLYAGLSAGGAMAMGAIPFVGGAMASAAATITQTALQFTMAQQMFSIGKEMAWMPIAIMVLTSMFTAGISFAVILPMTPFFLFWAGEIAWVLAVIEAMIAAPLLSLGFISPGGHQHFGHAIPGLKMLLAVVFRPVLMVLGLLTGMVLTFVIIRFSSQGFQIVANQILSFAGSSSNYGGFDTISSNSVPLAQGIVACILLFTFCSFMMMAFTKCFSMIYVVPEKVMQWIGGMADKAGQQELQQMTQGMSQQASQGAQAGGSSTEKSIGAKQQQTQAKGQADTGMIQGSASTGQATGKAAEAAIGKPEEGSSGISA